TRARPCHRGWPDGSRSWRRLGDRGAARRGGRALTPPRGHPSSASLTCSRRSLPGRAGPRALTGAMARFSSFALRFDLEALVGGRLAPFEAAVDEQLLARRLDVSIRRQGRL